MNDEHRPYSISVSRQVNVLKCQNPNMFVILDISGILTIK